jgi:hypothetical protein
MTHTGEWQRPPCALCAAPIEATARADDAPVFLRESRRWAHWACWKSARRQPHERRMCKSDTSDKQVDFGIHFRHNGDV